MPTAVTLPNAYIFDHLDRLAPVAHESGHHVDNRQEIRRLKSGLLAASNPIINAGFRQWQRGTSIAITAGAGVYIADDWAFNNGTDAAFTVSRSTDAPAIANLIPGNGYSLLVDCTTADATIGAAQYCSIQQRVEGYNWAPYWQHPVTLTFWHRHTKGGTYSVGMTNAGPSFRTCFLDYSQDAVDTWEFESLTFPAAPSAGDWNVTNGIGVYLTFALAVGTDLDVAPGSWQTGNFGGSTNQINAVDSTANNFALWGVQFARGNEGLPYGPPSFGLEELLCKRYLHVWSGEYIGRAAGTTLLYDDGAIEFPVEFRAAPTVVSSSFSASVGSNGTPSWSLISPNSARVHNSAANWTTDADISLTAVISAEL